MRLQRQQDRNQGEKDVFDHRQEAKEAIHQTSEAEAALVSDLVARHRKSAGETIRRKREDEAETKATTRREGETRILSREMENGVAIYQ